MNVQILKDDRNYDSKTEQEIIQDFLINSNRNQGRQTTLWFFLSKQEIVVKTLILNKKMVKNNIKWLLKTLG